MLQSVEQTHDCKLGLREAASNAAQSLLGKKMA
jgi:hypothetical protein